MESNLASHVYGKSPQFIRNFFWKNYLYYIKQMAQLLSIPESDYEIKYIDPNLIEYCSLNITSEIKFKNIGTVKSGDWDKDSAMKFEKLDSFLALREHFLKNIPLIETPYYDKILQSVREGKTSRDCSCEDDLRKRFAQFDKLYLDIKSNGFRTQKEIGHSSLFDEITVDVGRDGKLLFENGFHRLAIAKILGLKNIPVIFARRHSDWVKFKKEVLFYSRRNGGKVYQPLDHPDLWDIPSMHKEIRWDIIKKNLPIIKGTVLDLGSQWGYFCHRFEESGFNCTAVEYNLMELYFLKKFKDISNKKFKIINKHIFDLSPEYHDITLALNIFHHFLKDRKDYELFIRFLNSLDTKYMFFEPHSTDESQMEGAYANLDNIEFIDLILNNSCLNNYKYLGKDVIDNGVTRNLYYLYT